MSARPRAGSIVLIVAVLALFGSLILLIGSLDDLSLRPGRRLPRIESPPDDTEVSAPELRALTDKDRLAAYVLGAMTLVSVACVFVFRTLRRQLLQYLSILFAVLIPMTLGLLVFGRLFAGWFGDEPGRAADAGRLLPEAGALDPPMWSVALASIAVAVFVLGVVTFLAVRWFAYRGVVEQQRAERDDLTAAQQALADQASETALQIRRGRSPEGEVIRCYREMDRLLSKRRELKPACLTPREFAASLRDLGIQSRHIQQLTELFEFVRYGNRDDSTLAEQALTCLDALRSTYGGHHAHDLSI
jgi:cbb3-type cytochrome oxidase subunit 3